MGLKEGSVRQTFFSFDVTLFSFHDSCHAFNIFN